MITTSDGWWNDTASWQYTHMNSRGQPTMTVAWELLATMTPSQVAAHLGIPLLHTIEADHGLQVLAEEP